MTDDVATLEALEVRRCGALMRGDADALAAMLSDDLVHIHLSGASDTRDGYLDGVRTKYRFRDVKRGPLAIRIHGDAAVMTGTLTQSLLIVATGEVLDVRAVTTQVWRRTINGWLLDTCHNAPLTAA